MSDPLLNAVLNKNAAALQSLFDSGAKLATIEYKHKNATKMIDGSVWTQVILSNWSEGAEVLTKNLPHMNNVEMVLLAVRSGSADVLKVLWEHLESINALEYTYQTQEKILRSVIGGMGQIYNDAFQTKDMTQTILTLVDLGVDLSGALPGRFEFKDFRPEGHSIWTRAFSIRKLKYVEDFWPTWETMEHWPRLNEMVFDLLNITLKDQKNYSDPMFANHAKDLLLKFLKLHGIQWLQQVSSEPPPNLFRSFNSDGGEIVKHSSSVDEVSYKTFSINRGNSVIAPSVLEFLCAPLQYTPSAWLRLPLIVSQSERSYIWPLWEQLHELDPNHTWLDVLSSNPSKMTTDILTALKSERPEFWESVWTKPDEYGISSHQKWMMMGGEAL